MALLVDTGILYALADADDAWHDRARDYVTACGEPLLVPVTVLPEVTYLLHGRLGPGVERQFVASLAAGELSVQGLTAEDLRRAVAVLGRHEEIGFVDATVVAVAERLGLVVIATTDRRHFTRIRPNHCPSFQLVP
jgi:predicted nucleic acid-binding protein